MSEERSLLLDSVARIFADHCDQQAVEAAREAGWSQPLWRVLEEAEVPLIGVPQQAGGAGGGLSDAAAVLRLAGKFCAPVPLAETGMLAGWMLAASGMQVPRGPLAAGPARRGDALALRRGASGWIVSGTLERVPWAAVASRIVALASDGARDYVVAVDPSACAIDAGRNLAHEPRNAVRLNDVALRADDVAQAGPGVTPAALYERGALSRAILIAGALERCLELAVGYAAQRVQFGRPIAQFQAIQQELARLAGEAAAAHAAALSAAGVLERGGASLDIAAAKIRCGEAAHAGSAIAHQVHGAIGATREYVLQQATTRLWSWRNEFGSEGQWAERLGTDMLAAGADAFWPALTG